MSFETPEIQAGMNFDGQAEHRLNHQSPAMPGESSPAKCPIPWRRNVFRHLLNGLVFLAMLTLSCVVLNRRLPYPDIPTAGEKIRYLALHGRQYDTLFTGSSRVNFQILPSIFDQTLAARHKPSKSFNAGILGMRPPEQGFYLEQVLRQPHDGLRWVFIELTSLEARTPKSRTGSARFAYWHDGRRMGLLWTWCQGEWAALRAASTTEHPASMAERWEPLSVWLGHVPPFLRRSANLGRASYLAEQWVLSASERAKQRNKWRALGKDRDGWMPSGSPEVMNDQDRAAYQESYEARLAQPARHFHDPGSDAATRAMLEAVVHSGATPIFFVPPMTTEKIYYPPADLAGNMIIWDFSDPRRYPELFEAKYHLDPIHLNTAGSELFTRILAQQFAEFSQ